MLLALLFRKKQVTFPLQIDGSLKKYEDLVTLKTDLENILGYKKEQEDESKTIFKINNFMTIKRNSKKESGKV